MQHDTVTVERFYTEHESELKLKLLAGAGETPRAIGQDRFHVGAVPQVQVPVVGSREGQASWLHAGGFRGIERDCIGRLEWAPAGVVRRSLPGVPLPDAAQ